MKKYSKPEFEACVIGADSILVDSLGVNGAPGGSQLGSERGKIFEEEEKSW